MNRGLWSTVAFLMLHLDVGGHVRADQLNDQPVVTAAPVVYLDVQASTWRPRGRISFGIEPVLRMKLTSAGFGVTQDPQRQHDFTVRVEYREERGQPVAVNSYGTDIFCRILLDHSQWDRRQLISIHESPSYRDLVHAPYVEVVEKLETNPYFFFLGDIVRGWHRQLDTTGALIEALDRQFSEELHRPPATPMDTLVSPAETFPDMEAHFAPAAEENTVDELGRLGDARAVELLERLMMKADRNMRLHAVHAMGQFDAPSIVPALTRVAQTDSDIVVRNAASDVLLHLSQR
jgi:HEAT repeat protein